jgi:hypothetical protein
LDFSDQSSVIMEMTAVVLHEGALAHYDVAIGDDGTCYARLQQYNGRPENEPPRKLVLHKERRRWVSNDTQQMTNNRFQDLSDELGYAIELKAKPLLDGRKRSGGHPAG